MRNRVLAPFIYLIGTILVVGFSCFSGTATPMKSAPGVSGTQAAPPVTNGGQGHACDNIQCVQQATIQIESDGTFVDPQEGVVLNAAGRGSGFIIDPSGLAVTNNHVVTGAALIKVWVNGETTPRNAEILGVSECSDLAVIKIEGSGFSSYLDWYSQAPKVGLEVYTAGFPLGQPQYSLTKGIISENNADGQTSWASLDHVLAHDATINPGNSGGPLVDDNGHIVGINYAGNKSSDQYFAIDAATAEPLVKQLEGGQDIDSIGINGTAFITQDQTLSGIWIASVKSGSPADKAGMQGGDILLQMEGLVLATDGTMKDYCSILRTHKASDALSVKVYRYSTGDILEGELNGNPLKVTQAGSGTSNQQATATSSSSSTTNAPAYFTENFQGDLSNWSYNVHSGNANQFTQTVSSDGLSIRLDDTNLAVYYQYNPWVYTDVIIDAIVTNKGVNSNNINLICRVSDDGWYEFTVQNDGLYSIWVYDKLTGGNYQLLYNGGSNAINMGKAQNDIGAACVGTTLSLFINGTEVHTMQETTYGLTKGYVGFGVNVSQDNLVVPVIVDFNSFQIAQP